MRPARDHSGVVTLCVVQLFASMVCLATSNQATDACVFNHGDTETDNLRLTISVSPIFND